MKIDLSLSMDNQQLLKALDPKIVKKATNRTINEVGRKFVTKVTKETREDYNITASNLKKAMKVVKSSLETLDFNIKVESELKSVGVNFGARKLKKKGYTSFKIKKKAGKKPLQNSFFAKNGKVVLFRVKGTREVHVLKTLSIPQMFKDKTINNAQEQVKSEFPSKLKHNLEFYSGMKQK